MTLCAALSGAIQIEQSLNKLAENEANQGIAYSDGQVHGQHIFDQQRLHDVQSCSVPSLSVLNGKLSQFSKILKASSNKKRSYSPYRNSSRGHQSACPGDFMRVGLHMSPVRKAENKSSDGPDKIKRRIRQLKQVFREESKSPDISPGSSPWKSESSYEV